MSSRKAAFFILLILLVIPALAGCAGAREVDDWAYVYMIGIDRGISNNLRMTLQIATLKGGNQGSQSGQGRPEDKQFTVITLDCATFYSGLNMINSSLSRRLNYSQAKYFICSEDLAKEDIGNLMSAFARDRQIRRTMHMIFVRGQASDFIKAFDPILGISVAKTHEGMMDMHELTGLFFDVNMGHFIDAVKSTKTHPVAILAAVNDFSAFQETGTPAEGTTRSAGDYYAGELPRTGGNRLEYLGTALFRGGRFVGELNGDETRCLLMVQGDFRDGSFAFPGPLDPEELMTVKITQRRTPLIQVNFRDQKAYIHVKVFLEGDLKAIRSDTDYESPELKPILNEHITRLIKKQLDKTIDICHDLNCDAFGFGETACMQFPTIQEWEAYNWLDRFKDTEITTEVEFEMRRTGTMIKTNPSR